MSASTTAVFETNHRPEPSVVIVYHKSSSDTFCDDGFAAAFAAWLYFGNEAIYLPAIHSEEIPIQTFIGKRVFFLDFSYDLELMQDIERVASKLIVMDHHKHILEQAGDTLSFRFSSTQHSAAVLAWYYFHDPKKKNPLPLLFAHIEDNDLWRHQLKDSRAFIQRLRLESYQFKHWKKLFKDLDNRKQKTYKRFIKQGNLLQQQITQQCGALVWQAFPVTLCGIQGLAVNANCIYASELGHLLSGQSRTFAAVFVVLPDGWIDVRLRSRPGECDVSEIAQFFGGGGHPCAAGFRFKDYSLLSDMHLFEAASEK